MREYHKINSIYKRDDRGKFLLGQYSQPEFEYLADNQWFFTEKVDGTNIRVAYEEGDIVIAGRTDKAQIPPKLLKYLTETFTRELLEPVFNPDDEEVTAILHGEGYGAGIQSGGNYREDQGFVLFDIQINGLFLKREDVVEIGFNLDIMTVPEVLRGDLKTAESFVRDGFKSEWGDFPAEGVVGYPMVPLQDRRGNRVVIKMKTKDYR